MHRTKYKTIMANSIKIWRVALVKGQRYNWSQKEYSTAGDALRDMAKYVDTLGEAFNGNIYVSPQVRYLYEPKEGGAK